MQISKRCKVLLTIFISCISIGSIVLMRGSLSLDIIAMLEKIEYGLGKDYIRKLIFELAPYDQQIFHGEHEKYVLNAQDGSRWIFKPYTVEEEGRKSKNFLVYKLAKIIGINTPPIYDFSMAVNGKLKNGTLQKFVWDAHDVDCFNDFIEDGQFHLIPEIMKYEIFFRLILLKEGALLIDRSEKIYQIDLDKSFNIHGEEKSKDMDEDPCALHFDRLKKINVQFKQGYECLNHISEINNDWLIRYLKLNLVGYPVEVYEDKLNDLLKRKEKLLKDLSTHYSLHPNFSRNKLIRAGVFRYRLNICKDISGKILKRLLAIYLLQGKKASNELCNINVICSVRGWYCVYDALLNLKRNQPKFYKNASRIQEELEFVRKKAPDFRERLALTYYMIQLQTIIEYLKLYDPSISGDYLYENPPLIPIICNVSELHESNSDWWYSLVKYQTKGKVLPQELKGQRQYVLGLIKLINHSYKEAIEFLEKAELSGYAIEEINEIKKSIMLDVNEMVVIY